MWVECASVVRRFGDVAQAVVLSRSSLPIAAS